jgi:hypothetical protein
LKNANFDLVTINRVTKARTNIVVCSCNASSEVSRSSKNF